MGDLRKLLGEKQILIADGATGTMLQMFGLRDARCAEEWNLKRPEIVAQIPRAYADAGSDIVYTNTFGGNRIRLARAGMLDLIRELNFSGARIAKEAVGDAVVIAGSMGPTGDFLEPLGTLTAEEVRSVYAEQASLLLEGGVDALALETFASLDELLAAVEGVRSITDAPLIATMSFDTGTHTMMGVSPKEAVNVLSALPVDAFGFNCGSDLESALQVAELMASCAPNGAVLVAKPNGGKPRFVAGEVVWDVTPIKMAEAAVKFAWLGFRIIGGCCGTTPEHIRAIANALRCQMGTQNRWG
ncbi:MAG: homocysteine S-methyltransferase family protein [Armatimonadota bacterium]|nr:homocysteine S-methyltransferase family protein [Armatimonadota bacterium]MDW8025596.1 homocysteine S-methyltransferase family protein [Armatimonadota bacterium]